MCPCELKNFHCVPKLPWEAVTIKAEAEEGYTFD